MAIKTTIVTVAIWSLLLTPYLQAGCGVYFRKQVVYAAPVVLAVAPPVYQVGGDLEIKAAVEKALREREAFAQQQAFQAKQNQLRAYQQQQWEAERNPQQPTPTNQPQYPTSYPANQDFSQLAPTVYAKCGQCHATANSSSGATFDLSQGLNGDQFLRVTDLVANKTNVPDKMVNVLNSIKPEEYGKLLDEFIKIAKATKGSIPPQVVSSPPTRYGY